MALSKYVAFSTLLSHQYRYQVEKDAVVLRLEHNASSGRGEYYVDFVKTLFPDATADLQYKPNDRGGQDFELKITGGEGFPQTFAKKLGLRVEGEKLVSLTDSMLSSAPKGVHSR